MIDTDRTREKALLARYRDFTERIAGDGWGVEAGAGGVQLTTLRSTGESAVICTFHSDCLAVEQDLVCSALDIACMLVDFERRASSRVRALVDEIRSLDAKRKKSAAEMAGILINDRQFQRFLETLGAGGPVRDVQGADVRLKFLLRIASKTDLNNGGEAQKGFEKLRGDFEIWKRGGR